ncbi:MAG TPA: hypothetical protein VHD33_00740 [Legionellaceae bacterium]|nr:hypothetical protein [Legionellaceae bacterium]
MAQQYSTGFQWLHWAIAFIVILLLSLSFFLEDWPLPIRSTAIMLHQSLGITIW